MLFAGIHLQNKPNEFLPLKHVNFGKNVFFLKEQIAARVQAHAENLELIYNGNALDDSVLLSEVVKPNGTVHCFAKTKKYLPYRPKSDFTDAASIAELQKLFNLTAHTQINVNSRVNILHKILAEYPEFRRNLGAQALIRDSVLFNTLHQPEVIKNISEHYPIICEAAPFIVDTIKKELTRGSSTKNFLEHANDSTNSSEEENSLGASSSTDRTAGAVGTASTTSTGDQSQSENASIRMISRQQLQAALAQIGIGSVNSLSNIAQRNSDTSAGAGSTPLSNSASGERIGSDRLRTEMQRALDRMQGTTSSANQQQMDTTEPLLDTSVDADIGDIPLSYHSSPYVEQLRTMAQMGFVNHEENLTYLNITSGNIENAINLLMGSMN